MSATKRLRLGPLPKTENVKLTFACPASLKADLDRYAALHAQAYGKAVDATTLIPHMLEAFMAGIGDSGREAGARPHRRSRVDDAGVSAIHSPRRRSPLAALSLLRSFLGVQDYDDRCDLACCGALALTTAKRLCDT